VAVAGPGFGAGSCGVDTKVGVDAEGDAVGRGDPDLVVVFFGAAGDVVGLGVVEVEVVQVAGEEFFGELVWGWGWGLGLGWGGFG
jgi:hypothetical protein